MNKNSRMSILSVLARTALAFVFVFGQTASAGQSQNAKDNTTSNAAAKPNQAPANSSTAAVAKTRSVEEETASEEGSSKREDSRHGGQHESIKVHGHWTIEVRNADGSLVRHVEFENSLDGGHTIPNPTAGQPPLIAPGGAALLSGVLSGQWSAPAAASWQIVLVGPVGLDNLTTTDPNAPCLIANLHESVCGIVSPSSCFATPTAGLSCNLSVTPLGASPQFTGIQLSGSVAATQNGQVVTVATFTPLNCVVTSTPSCLPSSVSGAFFTSSTNFPGAPISVIAGQTIAVTVNISFS